jgi:hypothetical protein
LSSNLAETYPALAKDLLAPLLKLFNVMHDQFGGDFEQFFILGVIAARTYEDPRFVEADMSRLERGAVENLPSLGINLRSVSASTGIPLETVRRKVGLLCDKGWVGRNETGLCYTAQAFVALAPVRQAMLQQALCNHRLVQAASQPQARRA